MSFESELARCDRELEQIDKQPDVFPAWLVHLGRSDWELEKEFIRRKYDTSQSDT